MNSQVIDPGFVYELLILSSGYVIKPLHMLINLAAVIYLRNLASRDFKAIRIGLSLFLIGEIACALNYLIAGDTSLILEIVHDAGMIGLGWFLSLGLFYFIDDRLFHFTEPGKRCVLISVCQKCHKNEAIYCRMQRLFYVVILSFILISAIPLTSGLYPSFQVFNVFGTYVPIIFKKELLLIRFRIMPLAAIACLGVAFLCLWITQNTRKSAHFFFAGIGFLCYSLMIFFFTQSFKPVSFMSNFWEETTELAVAGGMAMFIYLFKDRIHSKNHKTTLNKRDE